MAISIDAEVSPRLITVLSPDVAITIQQLVDEVRAWETDINSLEYDHLIDASGKDVLGGDVFVGVTVTLKNAQLEFADRVGPTFVQCQVRGGNLVAVDGVGDPIAPIATSDYTQVVLTQSSSATLQNVDQIAELHRLAGLETGTPLVVTATTRVAGAITQDVTEAPAGTFTVERT